jgi:hypothetical protein
VGRPFDLGHGLGDGLPSAGKLLLQLGLEVHVPLERVLDPVGEGSHDRAADRFEAVLQIERTETRLHERGEDVSVDREALQLLRVALVAAVPEQPPAELEAPADDGTALPRDDVCAELRERSLLRVGEALVELLRDGETEDAVPEELEPFIGIRPVRRPGGMRERIAQALRGQGVDQLEKGGVGALRPAFVTGGTRCSRLPVRRW